MEKRTIQAYAIACVYLASMGLPAAAQKVIPPKRSSQIQDGFGINSDLPREPYLPWDRHWWTRMFDAGVSWIRIGQYENSSDLTSWDWIEQKRGVYTIPPGLDDYVDSLVDNGVKVQVQLLYGNPMYTSPAGKLPDMIIPETGGFHNPDRSLYSVFWPPKTTAQRQAFIKYVKFVVGHFRGRIQYYALWNEQDIEYWNPQPNAEEYGRLLKDFVPAVHETDAQAKVIYGGQADPAREFARRALDICGCAAGIDVFAYHTYPGYGGNMNPEAMDYGAYGLETPTKLREMVRAYPGIKKDIVFWDDEFNSIPTWAGSDESVQSKYIPRGLLYNWAQGVRTFVWLLAAATDGNEYDDFGMIHGLRYQKDDFTPRPVFSALQNTNALFSDTTFDPSVQIVPSAIPATDNRVRNHFVAYGFRNKKGKLIVAYWLAEHSVAGDFIRPIYADLQIVKTQMRVPLLIDVVSGNIETITKPPASDIFRNVPIRDSVMAITEPDYFDWPVLPEAPSSLTAAEAGQSVQLHWEMHGGDPVNAMIERRAGDGKWSRLAQQAAGTPEYTDSNPPAGSLAYRVRAANAKGESAYSNIVRPRR